MSRLERQKKKSGTVECNLQVLVIFMGSRLAAADYDWQRSSRVSAIPLRPQLGPSARWHWRSSKNLCPSSTDRRNIVVRHRSRDRVPLAPPGREAENERQPSRQTTDPRMHSEVVACVAGWTRHIHNYVKTVGPLAMAMSRAGDQISCEISRLWSLGETRGSRHSHQPSVECLIQWDWTFFSARQHYIARYTLSPVRPSLPLSVRHTGESVKDGWSQDHAAFATSSPMTSFLTLNFTSKFQREHRERGRRIRDGYEKYAIFSQ